MKKLYEITGDIRFVTVVYAESAEQALEYINGNFSADMIGVSDIEVTDVRDIPANYQGRPDAIQADLAHHIL